jgi:shikimate 5-dehydrogenase
MAIDASSRIYCLLGNPVAHSKGPAMHNAALAAAGRRSSASRRSTWARA